MIIYIKKKAINLTLEKVLSAICFLSGMEFLIAALFGAWRYLITMFICFAIAVMISSDTVDEKEERH